MRGSAFSVRGPTSRLWRALLPLSLLLFFTTTASADDQARLGEARRLMHLHEYAKAQEALRGLLAGTGLAPEVEALARQDLDRLTRLFTVHTQRIGLLAPLSGPHKAIGEALRRGAELALGMKGGPTVVVQDSQGTPEGAAAAVEKLVLQDGVVALLGPVGDRECRAAALRASELEVPIVLLGAADDLSGLSPWVFRHRITPEAQARAIAQHGLLDLGLKSFAILYPDDPYGQEMMDAFWDEVERGGGEIRAAVSYPAGVRDTTDAVRQLLGGFYPGARTEPFEIKGHGKELAYSPIVDFEALFLPDSPRRARQILSQVNYFDVALRTSDDPLAELGGRAAHAPVQVLGPASWNGPDIARGAEPVVQGAHFPGALVFQSPRPVVQSFIQNFRSRHGRLPGDLEAQAYDAAGWLWLAWQRGARLGRPALQQALHQVSGFLGVGGEVRVQPDGATHTELTILSVHGEGVVPILTPSDRARGPVSGAGAPAPGIQLR